MAQFAIHMADGSVGIMQTVGDVTPEECLAKWHPNERAKVVRHRPIDQTEADKIRAARKTKLA